MVVYCDESGNSGGNYLDPQQPVYVLAGWSIEKKQQSRADKIIERFKNTYYPYKEELKGAEILSSNEGQRLTNELFYELGQAGCVPFFTIAEKRYCVAGKIVEAFFDSEHNENILPVFSWMNGIKKDIAELIYNISKVSIEKFAQMHKNPSIESVKDAQLTVMNELTNSGYQKLANVIDGSSKYIEEILWEETHSQTAMPRKALHSLNLPTFISFIQLIEKANRAAGLKTSLFHDETKQFQEAYPEVFSIYKNARESELILENGMSIITGFRSINSFKMKKSVETPMIQGADLLASFINKFATNVILNKRISPEMNKIGELIAGSEIISMTEELKLSDIVGSADFVRKMFNQAMDLQLVKPSLPEVHLDRFLT